MPRIIGTNYTLNGKPISDFSVGDEFESYTAAASFVDRFVSETYAECGYDIAGRYWWGRPQDAPYTFRFHIE